MAVAQNIGVPWIMCQQFDTPDPVVRDLSAKPFQNFQLGIANLQFEYIQENISTKFEHRRHTALHAQYHNEWCELKLLT